MKINELIGYRNIPGYKQSIEKGATLNDFVETAKSHGWKFYGSGGNGAVLGHPSKDFLYKISFDRRNSRRYIGYVTWSREHQDNPYVPKVGRPFLIPNTTKPRSPNDKYANSVYVNKVEKLYPPTGKNDPRFKKYIDKNYVDNISHLTHDTDWSLDFGETRDTLYDHAIESLKQHDKHWNEILDYAYDALDLGIENIMFRKNGQLVFIDAMA